MKNLTLDKSILKKLLLKNTRQILQKANSVRAGHIGGSVSMSQFLLPILYYLEIENSINYRLVLSKGHASLGLYSILSLLNINKLPFKNYCTNKIDSFHGHTCKNSFDKLLASTGSLGHGLPIAMGYSYAEKLNKSDTPVICIMGDGELQEGTFWESILHFYRMNLNIKILIDFNNSIDTDTLKIDEAIKSFLEVHELNAFSYSDLKKAIELVDLNGPRILLFNTVKLANVKNYESKAQWHAGIPNSMELNDMLNMINIKLED